MKILLVNQDWFKEELIKAGHSVVSVGLSKHLDWIPPVPIVHIEKIIAEVLAGQRPDLIYIQDNSAPIWIMGLDEIEIPIVFYSVDAHHHAELHAHLGRVFDYILVAQRDYIYGMQKISEAHIEWMPLWASRYVEASSQKENGTIFIGALDPALNPDRVKFFQALQEEVDVKCFQGQWWQYFPHSRIVINQTVKGDLNFRVFEAMISGAMLLTEASPNGLLDIFEDGKHLVTYKKNDVKDAAAKIRFYLEHSEQAESIALAGRAEVLNKHLAKNRLEELNKIFNQAIVQKQQRKSKHFGWMINCGSLAAKLLKLDPELAGRGWLYAMKAAEAGVTKGELLDEHICYPFVNICSQYGRYHQSDAGMILLEIAREKFPNLPLIFYALVREYLNRGLKNQAEALAQLINPLHDIQTTFKNAEQIVSSLLSDGGGEARS